METEIQSQSSDGEITRTVRSSPRRGLKIVLAIVGGMTLIFVALTVFFWVRSSALSDRVRELDDVVALYEVEQTAVEEDPGEGEERDPSETTYLAMQTQNRWDGGLCTFVYNDLKDFDFPNETLSGAGLSASGVLDSVIQQAIVPQIVVGAGWTEEYFTRIASRLEQGEDRLLAQCNFHNRLFIAVADEYGELQLLEWVPDELDSRSRFDAYQPIDGMMDMGFSMFAYDEFDQPTIWTGYGDAGHLWWELHVLDEETHTSDLIERCLDAPVYDENENWTDERVIECDREYVPKTE